MDDSFIARLGYDPVRIYTHIHGHPPAPGGIVRLSARAPAEPAAEPAADARPPGAEAAPDAVTPPLPEDCADTGPAAPSPEPPPSPVAEPPRSEPAQHGAGDEADWAGDMQAWLVRNWQAIEALAAAGCLPELTPPASAPAPAPGEDPEPAGGAGPTPPPPEPPAPTGGGRAKRAASPEAPRPVHVRRGDRWNKPRMAEFLRQLAATHSVSAAARSVGMHRRSAYKLRARLKGQPFDIAWEAAFRHGYDNLAHAALDRALNGVEVPHYHGGELVGTHRRYDERLTVALLAMRNQVGAPMLGRYGAAAEYWGDRWDALLERVETGSTDWSDECAELGPAGVARLELPDAASEAERIIVRNLPDDRPVRRR